MMTSSSSSSSSAPPPPIVRDHTRQRIERLESERNQRRQRARELRHIRAIEEEENRQNPSLGDVDFVKLIRRWRDEHAIMAKSHDDDYGDDVYDVGENRICVCVRKRSMNEREISKCEHDAVTIYHPTATVHSPRMRVDGMTKYCDHNTFVFDRAFDEYSTTQELYGHVAMPLVRYVLSSGGGGGGGGTMDSSRRGMGSSHVGGGVGGGGVVVPIGTVFAYGQTGSGKTYTMGGIQRMIAEDVFAILADNTTDNGGDGGNSDDVERRQRRRRNSADDTIVSIAMFEIYGTKVQDLLNNRNRLKVLEDGRGEVVISGLGEYGVSNPKEFATLIDRGHAHRTTHATEMNDSSSRSHAVCQILLRDRTDAKLVGKLSLVDLAGSERGNDTKHHDRQRRTESSDINTSLLALKECIRAIDAGSGHVPYRQSKLTLILKDCFVSDMARTAMIATLSPGSGSTDHTVNTLRYADRIKEKRVAVAPYKIGGGGGSPPRSLTTMRSTTKGSTDREERQQQATAAIARPPAATPDVRDENEDEYDELEEIMNDDDDDTLGHDDHAPAEDDHRPSNRRLSDIDRTLRRLLEEEENLLNLHMKSIHENAELLTEEGSMLQVVQGEDGDMDTYASRLGEILDRKTMLIRELRERLGSFRNLLMIEEELSGLQ